MDPEVTRLVLYSRENCPLCDEMFEALAEYLGERALGVTVLDVDADPVTRRRFGLKVPVLTLDGLVVCHGRLDPAELQRLLDS